MRATIRVTFKPGVLEPQGKAVLHSLHTLGFSGVTGVRVGKLIEMDLDATDPEQARADIARMCDELLASPVVEDYEIALNGELETAG